jgi:hypothetical protein
MRSGFNLVSNESYWVSPSLCSLFSFVGVSFGDPDEIRKVKSVDSYLGRAKMVKKDKNLVPNSRIFLFSLEV